MGNYEHTFVQDPVTSRFLEYLNSKLVFYVYGTDKKAQELAEWDANRLNEIKQFRDNHADNGEYVDDDPLPLPADELDNPAAQAFEQPQSPAPLTEAIAPPLEHPLAILSPEETDAPCQPDVPVPSLA